MKFKLANYRGLLALAGICLVACAYEAQVVRLDPIIPDVKPEATSSSNMNVSIRVRDARLYKVIGHRASGDQASITTDQDVGALIKEKIAVVLEKKGFRIAPSENSMTPLLSLELDELSYTVLTDSETRKVKIQVVLKVVEQKDSDRLEKTFQANQERKIPFEPVAKTNEEWINETLSDTLQEFADDDKVFAFLTTNTH
jgi:uncharacterized lipoprotein YajG